MVRRIVAHRRALPVQSRAEFALEDTRLCGIPPPALVDRLTMNLHEYQSKAAVCQLRHSRARRARSPRRPRRRRGGRKALGGALWVVKAQIHAGGRGKAGGVKLASRPKTVAQRPQPRCSAQRLMTQPDRPRGLPIDQVYVESGSKIERELYLCLLLDRDTSHIAVHRLGRRRHGHRRSRRADAREDHHARRESGDGPAALPVPRSSASVSA